MKRKTIILLFVVFISLQGLAQIQYNWRAINQKILSLEKTQCSNENILSKLFWVRDKVILPGDRCYEQNDTLFIVEKNCEYSLDIDFWKNNNYIKEYRNALISRNPSESVIVVENFKDEYQYLTPCDQRRFVLCSKMDVEALNLESKKSEGILCEDPTLFTFAIRVIFHGNGRYTIDLIKFDGYDGMF